MARRTREPRGSRGNQSTRLGRASARPYSALRIQTDRWAEEEARNLKYFGVSVVTFINDKIKTGDLDLVLGSVEQGHGPSDPLQSPNRMILCSLSLGFSPSSAPNPQPREGGTGPTGSCS